MNPTTQMRKSRRPLRLLFVCPKFPHPVTTGLRIRQAAQLEALSGSFEVTVVSTHPSEINGSRKMSNGAEVSVEAWPLKPTSLGALERFLPLSSYSTIHPQFRDCHRTHYLSYVCSQKFDLLWVSRLRSAWTIGPVGQIPSVIDLDEIESRMARSIGKLGPVQGLRACVRDYADALRIHSIERRLCRDYTLIALAAAQDVERCAFPQARYLPNCPPSRAACTSQSTREPKRLLFIGTLKYYPNVHGLEWFLKNVWHRLLRLRPDLTLDVVGDGGDAYPGFADMPRVRVHGQVEDASAHWTRCGIAIAPIFAGGGTRIKILDAWQHGVPVVTTSVGIDGLEAVNGRHVLVADTPEGFAGHVEFLLSSPDRCAALAAAGRCLLDEKYSRPLVTSKIQLIAREALTSDG